MSRSDIIVGIDVGTHATRVAVCQRMDGGKPKLLGVGLARTNGVRHGYVINRHNAIKSLRAAIADAQKNTGVIIKHAHLGVGGISLRAEHIATTVEVAHHSGEVFERDISHAIDVCEDILLSRHHNVRVMHRIPLKYKLDGEPILGQPVGLRGKKLSIKVLFITAFEHHIEDMISVAHEAGVNIVDMAASPYVAALPVLSHADRMAGSALVDVGAETVSIATFEDNQLLSLEVFPIGSTDITNDIALGFQISLDNAEALKRGTLQPSKARSFPKQRVDEIVLARLSDITELIERHLDTIHRRRLLPAGIIITGGGAHLGIIPSFIKKQLELPVRVASEGIVQSSKRKTYDASWYAAYGLCAFVDNEADVRFRRPGAFVKTLSDAGKKLGGLVRQLLP